MTRELYDMAHWAGVMGLTKVLKGLGSGSDPWAAKRVLVAVNFAVGCPYIRPHFARFERRLYLQEGTLWIIRQNEDVHLTRPDVVTIHCILFR